MKCELQKIKGNILIYGAHLVALECARWLVGNGNRNKIIGFAVTDMDGNPNTLEGFTVKSIEDYANQRRDLTVIIAMPEKHHDEVERHAKNNGFHHFVKIGLKDMEKLKGQRLLSMQKDRPWLPFVLVEDENDSSWLQMLEKRSSNMEGCGKRQNQPHYKFPTLFHLDEETIFAEAATFDGCKDYEEICGEYRDLHALPIHSIGENNEEKLKNTMAIYMASSAWDETKGNDRKYAPWIRPIQVGSGLSKQKFWPLLDDMGDNISEKNRLFAEMTGAYWVWKNETHTKYKGLCHYRRHFMISAEEIIALEQNGIHALLTTPRYVPGGVKSMFPKETPVTQNVYNGMLRAISEIVPEDRAGFEAYMECCFYYPNNMAVARQEVYDDYCAWMFPILFRMADIDQEMDYGHREDRHIAYAAELLTSYYFVKNKDKYRIAVTDYLFG